MKKGLWKRRAFAFLVAAAMVIPQGVYAAETGENEAPKDVVTDEVPEKVHVDGCILASDHEGDCVTEPERVHEEGCTLAPDHEGDCVTEPERVHEEGCTLAPDHEGDCVTEPAESTEEQPERVHEDGCVLHSDHEGECEVEKQEEAMLLKAPRAEETIYVANTGSDDGEGTVNSPYASLKKAVEAAADGATIIVKDNITVNELARIVDKDITITSADPENPVTITRGDNFKQAQDNARSTYNPAMIEVTTPSSQGASLRLENIVLDDAGKHEGKVFAQAISGEVPEGEEKDNDKYVQDAIVAAYGTDTATAEIILGEDAVLKNFGGMSAVRVTTNSYLIMEDGSMICDDVDVITDRVRLIKNKEDEDFSIETGAAGAVWVQGNHFIMNDGATIQDVLGRGVYMDGGTAQIDGQFYNLRQDPASGKDNVEKNVLDMWQGNNGLAIHIRNSADVVLGKTFLFDNAGVDTKINSAVYNCSGTLDMQGEGIQNGSEQSDDQKAKICNLYGTAIAGNGGDDIEIIMNGEICGIKNGGNAINLNDATNLQCTIGEAGYIHDNEVWAGSIYMQGNTTNLVIEGDIVNNISTQHTAGIWLANNLTGKSKAIMKDTAEISGNISYTTEVAAVIVSKGRFIMEGGSITENYTIGNGDYTGGAVCVRRSGTFEMTGGSITNNYATAAAGGLYYDASKWSDEFPNVILKGGTISGNIMKANIVLDKENRTCTVDGGVSNDISISGSNQYSHINQNMSISDSMNIGNPDIYLEKYNVVLKNPADIDVKFGNASANVIQTLLDASVANEWSGEELASLWCQDASGSVELLMSKPADLQVSLPVYAAVVPTDETGNALTDASVTFYNVTEKSGGLNIAFPAPNANGYAVALVQPTQNYGTMNITAPNTVTMEDGAVIDYTVTYEMSENLANRLANGENLKNITMNVRFDKNVNIDPAQIKLISDMFDMVNATYSGNTLTVTCSMKDGWQNAASKNATLKFAANASALSVNEVVTASGDFNGEIERADSSPVIVFVPANAVQTEVVTNASCVTVKLADLIVYMGGEQGFENVVDNENGHVTASESLPEPGFVFDLPDEISSVGEIEFVEENSGKTWKAVPYDGKSTRVYKLESGNGQDPVRVEFTKDDGTKVVSDEFKVGDALNQKLHMAIYKGAVGTVVAKVGNDTYPVITQDATLEVRGTTNQVKYADVSTNPALQVGEPALKADSNTTFTINEGDVLASKDGVALLFDNIIENTASENNRTELLKDRAETELKNSYNECAFDLKYLDLVDRHNGNTWVKASNDVTIYWPYPEGTDKTTDFELLHFEDLHRDMSSNDVAGDIANCTVSPVTFTKLDDHIEFKIGSGGFSPFALVWEGEESDGGSSSGGSHTSNTYYVRYHNDDETEKDGKFIPGETVTVKGNAFTAPVGKVLAGWSLEEDGKVDYKVGDTFRMPGSSVDLYAVWKDAETESHSAYISGYPDGTVGPDKTITRAEAATMFYNLLADKTGDAKAFTDVPANQWYAKAVMTLAGKGVISGYPDGTFKPDASITRAEFVTMAMNFANAEKGTACSFPDVPQNMWYYGAIAGATQNGWISGYPDGTFGPDRYIARAEVTSVINRMENRAADMSFMMDHLDELRTFSDLSFGHWAYGSMMEAANGHDYTRADQNSYESWVDIH